MLRPCVKEEHLVFVLTLIKAFYLFNYVYLYLSTYSYLFSFVAGVVVFFVLTSTEVFERAGSSARLRKQLKVVNGSPVSKPRRLRRRVPSSSSFRQYKRLRITLLLSL